jgi:hypothetical protein
VSEPQHPQQSARARLMQRHARALEEWRDGEGSAVLDGDEFDREANRTRLASLRTFDPDASLQEELRVRLVSARLQEGALSFDAGAILLRPLQDSITSLAGEPVELELTGVSAGSTVLHVHPQPRASDPVDINGVPVDATSTEAPLRAFIELIRAAESESDLGQWVAAVDALGRFSRGLERLDAQADFAWSGVSGDVRSARFGETGRDYVKRMLETTTEPTTLHVSGRVTELRESGVVRIKTGPTKKSPAYEVKMEPDDLLGMHLEIGQTVHFVVRLEQQIDHLGQTRATDVFFVSSASGYSTEDRDLKIPDVDVDADRSES